MDLALDITFHGRVQGVGFRYTSHELAQSFPDITGWVRNELNGTVRMHLQGPEQILLSYLHLLTQESRMAHNINQMVKEPGTIDPQITDFRITSLN
ncbi:MAG: acylphosphatase [Akkermansia sp.]